MDMLTIDFETFYSKEYSLSKRDSTTQSYIDDDQFEVIGLAVKKNEEPTEWFSGTHKEVRNWLRGFDFANAAVLAHNAVFDMSILSWRFGIYPKRILDTLSMARALHGVDAGGSLKVLAERYGLGAKGTDVLDAMGKRRADFSELELARYGEYCSNDVELTHQLFKCLAPHFSKTEIKLIDLTIRAHSEPLLTLDPNVLVDSLQEVRKQKASLLASCPADKDNLMSNPKLAEVLRSFGVEPPMKVSARTGKETYAFAKSDEAFKELLEHDDPRVQAIVAARLGVKSTILESRLERFLGIAAIRDTLPIPLKYCAAISHRWGGAEKLNLQNLTPALKKAVVAPLGYDIVGADLSNIELRVGLYFAGQMDKLALLGSGVDLYKDFASSVFGVPIAEVSKEQRFIGKTSSLSLIYNVGAKQLQRAIKTGSGTDIGEEEATRIVSVYRDEYHRVKSAWYDAGRALDAIAANEYTEIGIGGLKLQVHGNKGILLPCGLYVIYPDLRRVTDDNGRQQWVYTTRKGNVFIHGGKVYQNCVQALARDVMGEATARVNDAHRVALTVHDALYCLARTEDAGNVQEFILNELRKAPTWMPGIPLDAEGGHGQSLKDAG